MTNLQLQFMKKVPWSKESEKLMDIVEGRSSATEDFVTKEANGKMGKVIWYIVLKTLVRVLQYISCNL